MRSVTELAKYTGVSVRTLHHYDAIGLLKPTRVTESGYRYYDDAALERLYLILLFRELEFPLKDIGAILDAPDFDRNQALNFFSAQLAVNFLWSPIFFNLGAYGLALVWLLLLLAEQSSFGVPTLSNMPMVSLGSAEDSIIRFPFHLMKKRGRFLSGKRETP